MFHVGCLESFSSSYSVDNLGTAPDFFLDLIFKELSEDDLYEAQRVCRSWFYASLRRMRKLEITFDDDSNQLKSAVEFYNANRGSDDKLNWLEVLTNVPLYDLKINDPSTAEYLVLNGCNTRNICLQNVSSSLIATLASSTEKLTDWINGRKLESLGLHFASHGKQALAFLVNGPKNCQNDTNFLEGLEKIRFIETKPDLAAGQLCRQAITKIDCIEPDHHFVSQLLKNCPNIEELSLRYFDLTADWQQIIPPHLKRLKLDCLRIRINMQTNIFANFQNFGIQFARFLCQEWQCLECLSIQELSLTRNDYSIHIASYKIYPQLMEESIALNTLSRGLNEANLMSDGFKTCEYSICTDKIEFELEQKIPPAKTVRIDVTNSIEYQFSPYFVCSNPTMWEKLSLGFWMAVVPNSFKGLHRLVSLELHKPSPQTLQAVLEDCRSLRNLELIEANADGDVIRGLDQGQIYPNITCLSVKYAESSLFNLTFNQVAYENLVDVDILFQVFPNLRVMKEEAIGNIFPNTHSRLEALGELLIDRDAKYGIAISYSPVFSPLLHHQLILSEQLSEPLVEAQVRLRNSSFKGYLKGFKLSPRVPTQRIIYV